MELKKDKSYDIWAWFVINKQDELYYILTEMINNKLNMELPQMVENLLREKIDKLSFNIQTTVNGKTSANFREILKDMIIDAFKNDRI